jgi:hypothetical protein
MAPLVALLLVAGGVEVESPLGCPSAKQVLGRLRPLVPPDVPPGLRVVVASDGGALVVQLADAGGAKLAERRWLPSGSCESRAEEAAAVAAAWLGALAERNPTFTLPPPWPVEEVREAAPEPARASVWNAAFGFGVSTPGEVWVTPMLSFEETWSRPGGSGPYVGAGFYLTLPRSRTFPSDFTGGSTEQTFFWYRPRLGVIAGMRWTPGAVSLSAGGGLGGGLLIESMRGSVNRDFLRSDVFAFGETRAEVSAGAWQLWLALRLTRTLNYRTYDTGPNGGVPNSPNEGAALLGVGVPLSLGRSN